MRRLRDISLTKYRDDDAKRKISQFARAFLRYLAQISVDQRYATFDLFLQLPRAVKEQKRATEQIVTKDDIEHLLSIIKQSHRCGEIDACRYLNYTALVLLGVFTGQRPLATLARLTDGKLKEAIAREAREKPVVDILPQQDKIRTQHYCPLHPQVVEAMLLLLDGRRNDELAFEQLSFQLWLQHNDVRLRHGGARIVNGDLRKFAEQNGDLIGSDQSNGVCIHTHGVSGIEWSQKSTRCLRRFATSSAILERRAVSE